MAVSIDEKYADQIKKIEAEMKRPLPTPHVTCLVHYYPRGDETNAQAAMVTDVERPGFVKLDVFAPNSQVIYKTGVCYNKHPSVWDHDNNKPIKHAPNRRNNGCWEYVFPVNRLKSHSELHAAELQQKLDNINEQKRMELEREMARSRRELAARHPVGAAAETTSDSTDDSPDEDSDE